MAYGTNYVSPDKIAHNQWLFDHLVGMNKEVRELFKEEYDAGKLKGCTPMNKVDNFYYDVRWFESQLIAYLSVVDSPRRIVDLKEKYKAKRDELIKKWESVNTNTVEKKFEVANEWFQILQIEAFNNGFMMKVVKNDEQPEV